METIALSGTTGFLGCHLLARLLSRGHAIIALVRDAPDLAAGRLQRVPDFAGLTGAETYLRSGQLRTARVSLDQPRLGLEPAAFRRLADEVDAVWHCAASTNLEAPLETVSRVNVEGTRHMLDLAAAGRRP
ncbi:SDR family oxidoreductase [Streptomyces sp. NPDC006368]|uniref:SDR family oxidoreductase n=1 Tax=Streptomyces sp. NPDC006368 TaxID=3156760 RepID=UPI00339EC2C9